MPHKSHPSPAAGHSHAPAPARPHAHAHPHSHAQPHAHGPAPASHHAPASAPGHARQPAHPQGHPPHKRNPVFTKIFRWQTDKPGGPLPVRVEITGSFNQWKKTPLKYDRTSGVWQVTIEQIPGNCTHNYMLLVNGRPTQDKNCDGLAIPHTEAEKAHQLETPRGPRVFMLFSQTK